MNGWLVKCHVFYHMLCTTIQKLADTCYSPVFVRSWPNQAESLHLLSYSKNMIFVLVFGVIKAVFFLNYISVISSIFVKIFLQKCQNYYSCCHQSVPLVTVTSVVSLLKKTALGVIILFILFCSLGKKPACEWQDHPNCERTFIRQKRIYALFMSIFICFLKTEFSYDDCRAPCWVLLAQEADKSNVLKCQRKSDAIPSGQERKNR